MVNEFNLIGLEKGVYGMTAALSNGFDGIEFFARSSPSNTPEQNEAIYNYWRANLVGFPAIAIAEHDGLFEDKTPKNPVFITIKGLF